MAALAALTARKRQSSHCPHPDAFLEAVIKHRWTFIGLILWAAVAAADEPLGLIDQAVPRNAADCLSEKNEQLAAAALSLEERLAGAALRDWNATPVLGLRALEELIGAKQRVDSHLERVIRMRTEFVGLPPGPDRRDRIRNYLRATSQLIDLSGRIRYTLRDAVDLVAYAVEPDPEQFSRLLDLLLEYRVSVGASIMVYVLRDPPPDAGLEPFPAAVKQKALRLFALTAETSTLPALAEFVRQEQTSTTLLLQAIETMRAIGLPQDKRVGQDPELPEPAITARELVTILRPRQAPSALAGQYGELMSWLEQRAARGVLGDTFHVGGMDLQPGDWLLMRNPSPYNLFTDLSPGLFTHVGVVGVEQDAEGRRRFVIVDLPERGDRIPATNADIYLLRTVHYFFLRHKDPEVGRKMGLVASSLIGNESQFDLTFRTGRVASLRGKLDKQTRVHTYCAGFLLLCAQETSADRDDFFPIAESAAAGHCPSNLAKLGLAIGKDFVSPTGAIFSPQLQLVAQREPMYSPGREIKESVYDEFAACMVLKPLTPSPDTYQALRAKLAGLAKYNPWLAKALAKANRVSEHVDLEAAAKAAAVIETLDEIADSHRDDFMQARHALLAGPLEELRDRGADTDRIEQFETYRQQHSGLLRRLVQGQLTPRELRISLVDYYCQRGRQKLRARFFPDDSPPRD